MPRSLPALLLLFACAPGPSAPSTASGGRSAPSSSSDSGASDSGASDSGASDSGASDSGAPGTDSGEPARPDPFAALPDTAEGLTNTSASLEAVLEWGSLPGACDRYAADPSDRRKELLCGKELFFYESFGTEGVPRGLVDILLRSFPEVLGPGFSALGMIPDPTSTDGYPLGLTPSDDGQSLVFTCASCHVAPLADGRYAVGAPNHRYEYGQHNLVMGVFPLAASGGVMQPVDPAAEAVLQPLLDAFWADFGAQLQLWGWMATMLGAEIPDFSEEAQRQYASWEPGTMDFFIAPLPIDDGVHTVSKISALWSIPTEAEVAEAGMPHAMLGHTGNSRSLSNFARGFAALGGGDAAAWGPAEVAPLVAYIESLRPPTPTGLDGSSVDRGAEVFFAAGCIDCHDGPRGGGTRLYAFDEVGTDDALMRWMDPEADGTPIPGVEMGEDAVTNRIKSPRLVGLQAMDRFLHNGSVRTLEELLCVGGPRTPVTADAQGNQGHTFGCDTLTEDEKADLRAFLESH